MKTQNLFVPSFLILLSSFSAAAQGNKEINDLPDTVALTLRLQNDAKEMESFDLRIRAYSPDKVAADIASEKAKHKPEFDKFIELEKQIAEQRKTLTQERDDIRAQLKEARAKHAKEAGEMSGIGKVFESVTGNLKEKQQKEVSGLEERNRDTSVKIAKLPNTEREKLLLEISIESEVLKKLKPYWKIADDKNLGCHNTQTVAEFAPLTNKLRIMPFGVRKKEVKVKALGLDSYVIKACVDSNGFPSRVFAIKDLDRGEAYLSDVIINDSNPSSPVVQQVQIQKMKAYPGAGVVGQKLEEWINGKMTK